MPYSNSISDNKSLKVLLMGADITRGISPVSPFMLFPAAQPAPLQSSAAVPPSLPCLHPLPGAACSCVSQRGFQEALAMVEQRRHGLYHEPDPNTMWLPGLTGAEVNSMPLLLCCSIMHNEISHVEGLTEH